MFKKCEVAVVMGSKSDWPVMRKCCSLLTKFGVSNVSEIVSAHRTPEKLGVFAEQCSAKGVRFIIAGAGGAAHLPGMLASFGTVPVLGVPIGGGELKGLDSLLSISQMPSGVPVATFSIGESGAINAGLFAISCLSSENTALLKKYIKYKSQMNKKILKTKVGSKK